MQTAHRTSVYKSGSSQEAADLFCRGIVSGWSRFQKKNVYHFVFQRCAGFVKMLVFDYFILLKRLCMVLILYATTGRCLLKSRGAGEVQRGDIMTL